MAVVSSIGVCGGVNIGDILDERSVFKLISSPDGKSAIKKLKIKISQKAKKKNYKRKRPHEIYFRKDMCVHKQYVESNCKTRRNQNFCLFKKSKELSHC